METQRLRFQVRLGKFPIVGVKQIPEGFSVRLKLAGTTEATFAVPQHSDVREGDLLTLYTEVLVNANPKSTPI